MNPSFFRGSNLEQDARFQDKIEKEKKRMKFPSIFEQKVDMKKVNLEVIKMWITNYINDFLKSEDELVIDYTLELVSAENLDPKELQIQLMGFLDKEAPIFVKKLWTLLLDAQKTESGIPNELIELYKKIIEKRREEEQRIKEGISQTIDRNGANFRGRGRGRGRDDSRYGNRYRERSDSRDRYRDREKYRDRSRSRDRYRRRSRSRSRDKYRGRRYRSRDRYRERDRSSSVDRKRERSRSRDRYRRSRRRSRSSSSSSRSSSSSSSSDRIKRNKQDKSKKSDRKSRESRSSSVSSYDEDRKDRKDRKNKRKRRSSSSSSSSSSHSHSDKEDLDTRLREEARRIMSGKKKMKSSTEND